MRFFRCVADSISLGREAMASRTNPGGAVAAGTPAQTNRIAGRNFLMKRQIYINGIVAAAEVPS